MSAISAAAAVVQNPLFSMIGYFFPKAAGVISILQKYAPVIERAEPAIQAAIEAGRPVYQEAVKAIPKFAAVVSEVVQRLPDETLGRALEMSSPETIKENVTRAIGGFGPMTFEEEQRWMNSMTPGNDPSQENSRYTIG